MTSLYGTDTNYSLWKNAFPLPNTEYNREHTDRNFYYDKPSFSDFGTTYSRVLNTTDDGNSLETKREKEKEKETNKTKIGNALKLFDHFSRIAALVDSDPNFLAMLNKDGVTFFAPTDAYYDELEQYFQKNVPKQFGDKYRAMKIKEILQCFVCSTVIYPEQMNQRNTKIQTLSRWNDLMFEGFKLISPNHSKVLDMVQCENGNIYRMSHPILPQFLMGV